jgi:small subunit ribosomal protein S27Ae
LSSEEGKKKGPQQPSSGSEETKKKTAQPTAAPPEETKKKTAQPSGGGGAQEAKKKKKKARTVSSYYKVEGGTLQRKLKTCPRCGPGIFLAEHYDRFACGKCGYAEFKRHDKPV